MSGKANKKNKLSLNNDIKNEEELKPMSHYIDDRLELVKQIFSTLKPKTIKNLSPEFLKESPIEEIQEMCLKELLGISSKRLKSVIYATKCPTDTESSDSNDEENISLEEISSDSNDQNQVRRKKANKFGKTCKDKNENISKNENGKEISVLELLELQARARAIRSQLALEPIAKVELDDSEDSTIKDGGKISVEKKINQHKSSKNYQYSLKPIPSFNAKTASGEKSFKSNSNQTPPHLNSNTKPIKLKRNFSKPSTESISNNYHNVGKNNQKEKSIENVRPPIDVIDKNRKEIKETRKCKDKNSKHLERRVKEIKKENKKLSERKTEHSQSPDVLAILPSPEILSVSDSEGENKICVKKEKNEEFETETDSSSSESSNTSLSSEETDSEYSNDGKTSPEKMEDLRNIIQRKKIKETEKVQSINGIDQIENKNFDESFNQKLLHKSNNKINSSEICEKVNEMSKEKPLILPISQKIEMNSVELTNKITSLGNDENIQITPKIAKDRVISNTQQDKVVVDCEICKVESEKSLDSSNTQIKPDDDPHNDDVISLGDAELDYGINDHIEGRNNSNIDIPDTPLSPEVNQSEPEEIDDENDENENIHDKSDFIDLHDSSGEDVCTEENNSWNDRWLKSSKVSKILAASKLGNKVRDKVKKSKKAEKEMKRQQQLQEKQDVSEEQENIACRNSILLKFEEGSVKQYEKIKEIIKSPNK